MTNPDDNKPKTAAETMATLVAKKKAAQGQGRNPTAVGRQGAHRAAAARSASKSKPALRKS